MQVLILKIDFKSAHIKSEYKTAIKLTLPRSTRHKKKPLTKNSRNDRWPIKVSISRCKKYFRNSWHNFARLYFGGTSLFPPQFFHWPEYWQGFWNKMPKLSTQLEKRDDVYDLLLLFYYYFAACRKGVPPIPCTRTGPDIGLLPARTGGERMPCVPWNDPGEAKESGHINFNMDPGIRRRSDSAEPGLIAVGNQRAAGFSVGGRRQQPRPFASIAAQLTACALTPFA